MQKLPNLLYIGIAILTGITACTTPLNGVEELLEQEVNLASVDTCGDGVVLFQQQILPLLESSCSYSTCHDAESRAGNISMSSYEEIISQINPGNPEKSLLYNLVTHADPDRVMPPPPRPKMGEAYLNLIRAWINQGAQNTICKSRCSYRPIRLENIQCDDNGTPDLAVDDSISFSINPSGKNLGGQYRISGQGVDLVVEYGNPLEFKLPVGDHISLRIKDVDDSFCTFSMEIPTRAICGLSTNLAVDSCKLESASLRDVSCFDNGTPRDSTDDRVLFSLNPVGKHIGQFYKFEAVQGDSLFVNEGTYGEENFFQSPPGYAGKGDLRITLTDVKDTSCSLEFIIEDPGVCTQESSTQKDTCQVLSVEVTDVLCNDNGSPIDFSDDFFSFSLKATGKFLGSGFTLSDSAFLEEGIYDQINTYKSAPGNLGNGDWVLVLTDKDSSACGQAVVIPDPNSCLEDCEVDDPGFAEIVVPILETECISCHKGENPAGGILLDRYEAVKKLVENGELMGSISQLEGFEAMPPDAVLEACEIQQIQRWVDLGAEDN